MRLLPKQKTTRLLSKTVVSDGGALGNHLQQLAAGGVAWGILLAHALLGRFTLRSGSTTTRSVAARLQRSSRHARRAAACEGRRVRERVRRAMVCADSDGAQ